MKASYEGHHTGAPQFQRNGDNYSIEQATLPYVLGHLLHQATDSVSGHSIRFLSHALEIVTHLASKLTPSFLDLGVEGKEEELSSSGENLPKLDPVELEILMSIFEKHGIQFPDAPCESLQSGDLLSIGTDHGNNLVSKSKRDILSVNNLKDLVIEINTETTVYPILFMEEVGTSPKITHSQRKDMLKTLKKDKKEKQGTVIGYTVDNPQID